MVRHHVGVLALAFACLLVVPSWSDNKQTSDAAANEAQPIDDELNAGEPNGETRMRNTGIKIKNRNKNERKLEKKYKRKQNKKRNKNEGKQEKKYNQQKKKKFTKNAASNGLVSCGFDDNELSTNGTNRSPVTTSSRYVWANGKIPYYFSGTVTSKDRALIRRAMGQIQAKTCFRFEEKSREPSYHHLKITVGTSTCSGRFSAYVTTLSNIQMLLHSTYQLADKSSCNWEGGILHELMHTLGVGHTQKRKDRNSYIIVYKDNIKKYSQYEICSGCITYTTVPYDCSSIMHYGYNTFRKSGFGPTMKAINPSTCKLTGSGAAFTGARKASNSDWKLLNVIADKVCTAVPAAQCTGTSSDWNCCTTSPCQEKQGDCDGDSQCAGSMVCGTDNCKDFNPQAEAAADCCIKPKASCTGMSSDWNCCSNTSPCQEKQGDCDGDSQCAGSLVCGKDNCKDFNPLAQASADCCIKPKASCTGTSSDWNCCSDTSPCQEKQGDCDGETQCAGSLVCGKDNCKDFNPQAQAAADCCIKPKASCTGTSSDWNCCTTSPCQEKQGDCDGDSQCAGSLVCGKDNCKDFNPQAQAAADCCIKSKVCTGSSSDWNCCSSTSPCQEKQGDCDGDSQCAGSLVCGKDNCKDFYSQAQAAADCCIKK